MIRIILALYCLCNFKASAQKCSFCGSWQIASQEPLKGNYYPDIVAKHINILDSANVIKIVKLGGATNDSTKAAEIFFKNEMPNKSITATKRTKLVTAKIKNNKMLVSTTLLNPYKSSLVDISIKDNWVLKGDKLVLTKMYNNHMTGEEWTLLTVYKK